MSCKYCGKQIRKGERFVLVGIYPSKFKKIRYHDWFDGPEYFGELYHEMCYPKTPLQVKNQSRMKVQGHDSE